MKSPLRKPEAVLEPFVQCQREALARPSEGLGWPVAAPGRTFGAALYSLPLRGDRLLDGRKLTPCWPVVPVTAIPRWVIAFFGLVMVLTMPSCPEATTDEVPQQLYVRDVSNGIHDIAPVRGERGPLRLHRDGDEYECSMCHDGFEGDLGEEALKGEHSDITFSHGLNLLCLNCHHPKNSDVYVYHDGSEIPGDKPTDLCAKCHGPHYREWRMGVHGRENAYWDGEKVQRKKLDCIQCHNPHHPRFELMTPERPPVHTRFDLRAGGAHHDDE